MLKDCGEPYPANMHYMKQDVLEVVGAVIRGDVDGAPAVLAFRRCAEKSAGGKWEFPGGKVEQTETQSAALAREIREELGIEICVGQLVARACTPVDSRVIDLSCYWVTVQEVPTESSDHDAIQWVTLANLCTLDWAEPDLPAVEAIEAAMSEGLGGAHNNE